ncbi:MAG TPA: hypothetical protein VHE35_22485 [Kofleriaceae bacterium]|nr:hypothetical protein [Kofleriaceae bacterium]
MRSTLFASVAIVALAACGGSDPSPGTVNSQNARTSIDQVGQVNAALAASDGNMAASAVAAMTAAGQGIVSPSAPAGRLEGLAPDHLPRSLVSSAATGTANCTAAGCTFDHFGDDTPGNGWTIDGSISKSGDTITFDLTYDVTSGGATVDWSIDGSVTVTATSIDGSVHSKGTSSSGPAGGVSWDVSVDYQNVQLDGSGCPIGGSIHASTAYDFAAGSYDVAGDVTFGPACGQTR